MKITRFEDLKCWQEARKLVKEIYLLSEDGKLAKNLDTKSQIKRAALSSMNNIAEDFGKYSNKDFIRYLDIAHNSVSEVKKYTLCLAGFKLYFPGTSGRTSSQNRRNKSLNTCFDKVFNEKE